MALQMIKFLVPAFGTAAIHFDCEELNEEADKAGNETHKYGNIKSC